MAFLRTAGMQARFYGSSLGHLGSFKKRIFALQQFLLRRGMLPSAGKARRAQKSPTKIGNFPGAHALIPCSALTNWGPIPAGWAPSFCQRRRTMAWLRERLVWAAVLIPLAGTLAACDSEGPAEEAGETVDDAAEDAGDAVEDATD
jgi:hypothetical protein